MASVASGNPDTGSINSAGIKHLTFHEMRHTFASHLVMNGTDLPSIQALMGHADIKTTMRYSHLAPEHLHKAVHKLYLVPPSDEDLT